MNKRKLQIILIPLTSPLPKFTTPHLVHLISIVLGSLLIILNPGDPSKRIQRI